MSVPTKKTKEIMKRIERQIEVEDFTSKVEKERTEWAHKPWWKKAQEDSSVDYKQSSFDMEREDEA